MAPAIVLSLVLVAVAAAILLALAYDCRLQAVNRLLETRAAATALLSGMQDAETGQRGFLLTGERRYLVPFERARARLPRLLEGVRSHVAGDERQERLLASLPTRIAAKLRELQGTVALRRAGDASSALAAVRTGQGLAEMDGIRATVAAIEARAAASSRRRQTAARRAEWAFLSLLPRRWPPCRCCSAG